MGETLAQDREPGAGSAALESEGWTQRGNPLYVASALCILLGVYLASRDLEGSIGGRIAFAGVLEIYSGLLIAAAAWLVRAEQARSATTLALLSVFFLVDPTLRVEGMVTTDQLAMPLLLVWMAIGVAKLWLIGLPYGVPFRLSTHAPAIVAVITIAAMPWWVRALPEQR